jgi:hypothetical protein
MPNWLPLGTHSYCVEDDIFVLRGDGTLTVTDLEALYRVCWEIADRYNYWLVLVNSRAGVSMSPEARRFVGDLSRRRRSKNATAIYGGSIVERTLVLFVRNAVKLLHGTAMPIETFQTEADARSWLVHQRQSLRASLSPSVSPNPRKDPALRDSE